MRFSSVDVLSYRLDTEEGAFLLIFALFGDASGLILKEQGGRG